MKKTFCDLCGKPIKGDYACFKIGRPKMFHLIDYIWVQLDVHEECVKKLFDASQNTKAVRK